MSGCPMTSKQPSHLYPAPRNVMPCCWIPLPKRADSTFLSQKSPKKSKPNADEQNYDLCEQTTQTYQIGQLAQVDKKESYESIFLWRNDKMNQSEMIGQVSQHADSGCYDIITNSGPTTQIENSSEWNNQVSENDHYLFMKEEYSSFNYDHLSNEPAQILQNNTSNDLLHNRLTIIQNSHKRSFGQHNIFQEFYPTGKKRSFYQCCEPSNETCHIQPSEQDIHSQQSISTDQSEKLFQKVRRRQLTTKSNQRNKSSRNKHKRRSAPPKFTNYKETNTFSLLLPSIANMRTNSIVPIVPPLSKPSVWSNALSKPKTCIEDLVAHRIKNFLGTDCCIRIGDFIYRCHKFALEAYCVYFRDKTEYNDFELCSERVTPLAFQIIYEWMISKDQFCSKIQMANVYEVLSAALFLGVEDLIIQCHLVIHCPAHIQANSN